MQSRSIVLIGAVAIAGAIAMPACYASPPTKASSPTTGRTAWGDPDLQGVWRYEAAIPLERPAQLAGRATLTAEEVAARERVEKEQAAKRLEGLEGAAVGRRSVAESPIRGNEYNSFWQDHGRPRQISDRTSLVVDPPDGQLPFTPDAKKAEARSSARYGVGPFESYLDPDTGERCLTDGVTGMMWQGPNGGHNRIVQSPGYVTILHEEYRDRRVIPLDGREHGSIRQWFGDAVGRWDGDTLVVDTTKFNDKTTFRGSGQGLHVVERFSLNDANSLKYQFTVEDPAAFTRAWSGESVMTRSTELMFEYACHEGNLSLPYTMRGRRFGEKQTTGK